MAAETPSSPRELILIATPDAGLRATEAGPVSVTGYDVAPFAETLGSAGGVLTPLFGSEERLLGQQAGGGAGIGPSDDLSVYYHVDAADEELEELADALSRQDVVESAYVKPPGEPPEDPDLPVDAPLTDGVPATPDFSARQIYLNAAPAGIDARYAWTQPGGRGAGVRIIDCEWGWNFTHEDLIQGQGGVVVGTGASADNHGTAVLGEYSGDVNSFGITGICSDAWAAAAAFSMPTAMVIRNAADRLRPGDILLLEIHRAGPRNNFQARADQRGYIAIEWWPDDYAAIRYATSRGILVVEAAGNGREDLDDAIYGNPAPGFPATWQNPFNPANPSSLAVVVGAGAPPPGTHGRDNGPDRSRLAFSNYGARVDAQGWGREVTTTGYGSLQGGPRNEWYTDTFSGTSSASPIVVGALGCVQGILRAQGGTLLTPSAAIQALRATGSPQQDAPGRPRTQRIGNRPDLRQLITATARSWRNDMVVERTYASHDSRNAWASIATLGWRKIEASTADGVTNTFQLLCEAVANSRRVDVYVDDSKIYRAVLR